MSQPRVSSPPSVSVPASPNRLNLSISRKPTSQKHSCQTHQQSPSCWLVMEFFFLLSSPACQITIPARALPGREISGEELVSDIQSIENTILRGWDRIRHSVRRPLNSWPARAGRCPAQEGGAATWHPGGTARFHTYTPGPGSQAQAWPIYFVTLAKHSLARQTRPTLRACLPGTLCPAAHMCSRQ